MGLCGQSSYPLLFPFSHFLMMHSFRVAVSMESDSFDEGVLEQYLALSEGVKDVSFLLSPDGLRESYVSSPSGRPHDNSG